MNFITGNPNSEKQLEYIIILVRDGMGRGVCFKELDLCVSPD